MLLAFHLIHIVNNLLEFIPRDLQQLFNFFFVLFVSLFQFNEKILVFFLLFFVNLIADKMKSFVTVLTKKDRNIK